MTFVESIEKVHKADELIREARRLEGEARTLRKEAEALRREATQEIMREVMECRSSA